LWEDLWLFERDTTQAGKFNSNKSQRFKKTIRHKIVTRQTISQIPTFNQNTAFIKIIKKKSTKHLHNPTENN
jgi:hypothetical protein